MTMADLDDVTAVLSAPDPRPATARPHADDAVRWIEWQERNYAEHDFGLWVVETHDGEFVGDCGLTMQDVEGTPHVEVGYHVMPGDAPAGLRDGGGHAPYATAPRRTASSTWSRSSVRRTCRRRASPATSAWRWSARLRARRRRAGLRLPPAASALNR